VSTTRFSRRLATRAPWSSDYSASQRRIRDRQISTGLHCLTGRLGADEVTIRSANARIRKDAVRFGLALHCFGDAYSHQVEQAEYDAWQTKVRLARGAGVLPYVAAQSVPMSKPGYMYPPITGHGPTGHDTDNLRGHQSKYLSYVGALFDLVMSTFGGAAPGKREGLLAGLKAISGMKFDGDDEKINAQQSAVIREYRYLTNLAPRGALNSYLPEF